MLYTRTSNKSVDSSYILCGETGETINHIRSECSKLAQREYKIGHGNVARMVHWILCEKCNLQKPEKRYLLNP